MHACRHYAYGLKHPLARVCALRSGSSVHTLASKDAYVVANPQHSNVKMVLILREQTPTCPTLQIADMLRVQKNPDVQKSTKQKTCNRCWFYVKEANAGPLCALVNLRHGKLQQCALPFRQHSHRRSTNEQVTLTMSRTVIRTQ